MVVEIGPVLLALLAVLLVWGLGMVVGFVVALILVAQRVVRVRRRTD